MDIGTGTITSKPVFMCAAIEYLDENGSLKIEYGSRHHEIYQQMKDKGIPKPLYKVEGFMVDFGLQNAVFVNRDQATIIAKKWNIPMIGSVLTSEDLW